MNHAPVVLVRSSSNATASSAGNPALAVGEAALGDLHPIEGIRLGVAAAGIRKAGRDDLLLIELANGTHTAAVFTRNQFRAAPVQVAERHIELAAPRYCVINTGNANAGTGERGLADAIATCEALAELAGVDAAEVLPFSTGVIGEFLPMQRLLDGLPAAYAALAGNTWERAAAAIMTTDTRPKGASVQFNLGGDPVCITGIVKGAGMIRPDMATMLGYVATDLAIEKPLLDQALRDAVAASFNRITIDGDTSTNDAVALFATGAAGNACINSAGDPLFVQFVAELTELCKALAQAVVRDGEGATKFVTVRVEGGLDANECLQTARTIAESPLVKTALFASDPNWGRILAAVGRAGVPDLAVDNVRIWLGDLLIAEQAGRAAGYSESAAQRLMNEEEIVITVDLGRGDAAETVWTTDLSHDYVRINAEYRT